MAARLFKAVLSGTIAAAVGPLLVIFAAANAPGWRSPDALPLFAQVGIALAISLVLVSAATFVIGTPARIALSRLKLENVASYVLVGAMGGASFVAGLLALFGATAGVASLSLAAFSGAVTGYMWDRSRPGADGPPVMERRRFVGARLRMSAGVVTARRWPPATIPPGDISVPPVALVVTLCVMALAITVAAGADGRFDWLPRQEYFPPSYRTTRVLCLSERDTTYGPTLMINQIEEEWYQQHLRAAQEPSLYLASRASGAEKKLAYRFTWLRTFDEPVIVRVDETSDGGLTLSAKQMSGRGGYSPGRPISVVERQLTDAEAAKLRSSISASRLFEQPQIGCLDGADGSKWLIEANDHGRYRYLQRSTPQGGPVREAGLILLGFTGWTFRQIY